jgi:hypothetical protein
VEPPTPSRFDSFDGRHVETWQRDHIQNPEQIAPWTRPCTCAACEVVYTTLVLQSCSGRCGTRAAYSCRRKRVPDRRPTSDCAEEAASDRGEVQDKRHTGLTRPVLSKKKTPEYALLVDRRAQNPGSVLSGQCGTRRGQPWPRIAIKKESAEWQATLHTLPFDGDVRPAAPLSF